MAISEKQPYSYQSQGDRFYAFFLKFEEIREYNGYPRPYRGTHFFVFDKNGLCWLSAYNVARQFIKMIGNGIFLENPAWEADTNQMLRK